MIHVIGGTYWERCERPEWDQLYGSGGRAAAALSKLTDVRLTTYVGEGSASLAKQYASAYEYELSLISSPRTYAFRYLHSAGRPILTPYPAELIANTLILDADDALVFGMLEGSPTVCARRVVYDPQSPEAPSSFFANGSKADSLAVVLNVGEGQRLTGEESLPDIGRRLLEAGEAHVVVLKCGPSGGLVFVGETVTPFPAYATETVWAIGSGDVFSAAFAYLWLSENRSPEEAAVGASAAAAAYCATRSLPLTPESFLPYYPSVGGSEDSRPRIYLAGPFFDTAALWLVEEMGAFLTGHGAEVFSPYHDVGLGGPDEVVDEDLQGIVESDAVLALLDGLDPGTLFEVGYARSRGIPVVALAESVPEPHLTMFRGSGCEVVHDTATALYRALWAALRS